jgi:hypothetical protein
MCGKGVFPFKRGLLDAFKLKYHNKDYEKILKLKTDLHFIDKGNFLPSLLDKRKKIIGIAKEARLFEGKNDINSAVENIENNLSFSLILTGKVMVN